MIEKVLQISITPNEDGLSVRIQTTHRIYHCNFKSLQSMYEVLDLELRDFKEPR